MNPQKPILLILDPDGSVREALALRLGALDVEVVEAGTLEEAKSRIQDRSPDWLICDWALEGREGQELFKALGHPAHRTCVYTAGDESKIAPLARSLGVKGVYPRKNRFKLIEDLRAETAVAKDPESGGGQEVLIVDDSAAVRVFVRKALEPVCPLGSFREADNGRTALTEMTRKKVDFIVTDLEMPGMDGHEFIERIRANPLLKKKPILVFSAKVTDQLLDKYREDRFLVFLRKPCLPEAIASNARTLIEA